MAKKLALLLSLVMIFSISCVFAEEAPTDNPADVTTSAMENGDLSGEDENALLEEPSTNTLENEDLSTESVSPDETESGNVSSDDSENVTTTEGSGNSVSGETNNDTETESKGNSTVIGAIIAVVIVVAVVAVVCVIQKK